MKSVLFGIVVFSLVSNTACRDILDSRTSKILSVVQIDAPARITAGSPLSVDLTISIACNSVERVEIQRNASRADITVWAPASRGNEAIECTMYKNLRQTVTIAPPFAPTFTVSANGGTLPPVEATVEVQ